MMIFSGFISDAAVPVVRRIRYLCLGVLVIALAASWSPLDVTFHSVEGGPKILKCCPGAPYSDGYRATLDLQKRGVCVFCSDLLPPNSIPRWYLAW